MYGCCTLLQLLHPHSEIAVSYAGFGGLGATSTPETVVSLVLLL